MNLPLQGLKGSPSGCVPDREAHWKVFTSDKGASGFREARLWEGGVLSDSCNLLLWLPGSLHPSFTSPTLYVCGGQRSALDLFFKFNELIIESESLASVQVLWVIWPRDPKNPPVSTSLTLRLKAHTHIWLLFMGPWDWTQVLMLGREVLNGGTIFPALVLLSFT